MVKILGDDFVEYLTDFIHFLVYRGISHNNPLDQVRSTPSWKSLESAKMSREHLTAAWELHFITWPLCDCKCSCATVQLCYSATLSAAVPQCSCVTVQLWVQLKSKLCSLTLAGASFAAIMCRNLDSLKLLASWCKSSIDINISPPILKWFLNITKACHHRVDKINLLSQILSSLSQGTKSPSPVPLNSSFPVLNCVFVF